MLSSPPDQSGTLTQPATRRHVIGPSWRGGTPALQMWVPPENRIEVAELAGELCLTPLAERRCVGRRDAEQGGRVPCPSATPLARGTQCDRCRFDDGFSACITCDGSRCPVLPPAVERYCRSMHHLYLMDIGAQGRLKVGTAVDGRQELRVLEQGPVAAALVAAGPGPQIKQLEKAVARLGLRERFAARQKAAFAFRAADVARSRARILAAYAMVRDGVPADLAAALHAPEFVALPPPADRTSIDVAAAAGSGGGGVQVPQVRSLPVRAGHTIRGQICGVRGAFVLLDTAAAPGVYGVLDLSQLRARMVDLAPAAAAPLPPAQLRLL